MYFADTISRAHTTPNNLFDNQLTVAALSFGDITRGRIISKTANNPIELTQNGWPEHIKDISNKIKPYFAYKYDLIINEGLLMKDNLIVIPQSLRGKVLELVHESHLGRVKCKQLTRNSVFWLGINKQIEDVVTRCQVWQNFRHKQNAEPMIYHNMVTFLKCTTHLAKPQYRH